MSRIPVRGNVLFRLYRHMKFPKSKYPVLDPRITAINEQPDIVNHDN